MAIKRASKNPYLVDVCRCLHEGIEAVCSLLHGTRSCPCVSGPLLLPVQELSGIGQDEGSSRPGEQPQNLPDNLKLLASGRMTGLSTCGSRSARS